MTLIMVLHIRSKYTAVGEPHPSSQRTQVTPPSNAPSSSAPFFLLPRSKGDRPFLLRLRYHRAPLPLPRLGDHPNSPRRLPCSCPRCSPPPLKQQDTPEVSQRLTLPSFSFLSILSSCFLAFTVVHSRPRRFHLLHLLDPRRKRVRGFPVR